MFADTAHLAADLTLNDHFSGPAARAKAAMTGLGSGVGRITSGLQTGFSKVGMAASKFGSVLGHAKDRIIGLLTGPLGMLGLSAGLLSLGGLFTAGVHQAQEFGGVVKRLAALTGLTVEQTSKLAAAFDHFGVSADTVTTIAGLAEKNLGLLDVTVKKNGKSVNTASTFYKMYGLQLLTTNGHVKDFNTLLLDSADFWNNKAIPAQTKAVALSKLYGRSWQELIPILSAGRAGIADAEEEAARLGLTLTKDNIDVLGKAKAATRAWGDALGGLKLQIGLAVLPAITSFTKGLTTLVVDNRQRIIGFVHDLLGGAQRLATAFQNNVLPALRNVWTILQTMTGAAGGIGFSSILQESANFAKDLGGALNSVVVPAIRGIASAWDGLPSDIRQLIIKGFIANKVIKWTFGFSLLDFGKEVLKGFLGIRAAVVNVTGGVVNGPGGLPVAGAPASGGNLASRAVQFVLPIAAGIVIANAIREVVGLTPEQSAAQQSKGQFGPRTQAQGDARKAEADLAAAQAAAVFADKSYDAAEKVKSAANAVAGGLTGAADAARRAYRALVADRAALEKGRGGTNRITFVGGGSNAAAVAGANYLAQKFASSQKPFYQSMSNAARSLSALKALQARFLARGDTHNAALVGRDIKIMQGVLARKSQAVKDAASMAGEKAARAAQRTTAAVDRKKLNVAVTTNVLAKTVIDGRQYSSELSRTTNYSGAR